MKNYEHTYSGKKAHIITMLLRIYYSKYDILFTIRGARYQIIEENLWNLICGLEKGICTSKVGKSGRTDAAWN